MRLAMRVWAALAACTLVEAFPQQTAPPNATSPATTPGITPAPSCKADCTYRPPYFYQVTWTTNVVTENITYATVITIINTVRNTTRYVTSTVDLPDNYTLPQTNAAGTVLCPVAFQGSTTLLPFPSVVADYHSTYSWDGRLATTQANATGATICSDSGGDVVTFRSHPDFNAFYSSFTTRAPTPTQATGGMYGDPRGMNWGCTWESVGGYKAPSAFISASLSDEAALFSCYPHDWAPVAVMPTAAFLTASSVSYEGEDDVPSTSVPSRSRPVTSVPATAHIETSVPVEAPTPTSGIDDETSSAHIELPTSLQPPTVQSPSTTSLTAAPSAHLEDPATASPPDVTSIPDFAHPEQPATLQPPSIYTTRSGGDTTYVELSRSAVGPQDTGSQTIDTAHVELSQSTVGPSSGWQTLRTAHVEQSQALSRPGPTAIPPREVGTVIKPPSATTTAAGGGLGGIIGSLVGSYLGNGGTLSTNVPVQADQSAGNNPPAGNQAPPSTNVPVGSTSVAIIPTVIPTVVAGTSTNIPAVVVGSMTLTAGQTAVIDNTPISVPTANPLAPQENGQQNNRLPQQSPAAVVIGGSNTVILPTAAPAAVQQSPIPPALTIGDQTIQPVSGGTTAALAYVISGQTVSPGSPITLGSGPSATIVALTTNAAGSSVVVVGSSALPYIPAAAAAITGAPSLAPLTLAPGQTIQPLSPSAGGSANSAPAAYVVGGQTLSLGGAPVTLADGTTLALTTDAAGNTVAVANGAVTQTLAPAAAGTAAAGTAAAGTAAARVSAAAHVSAAAAQITPAPSGSPLVIYGTTITPTDGTAYVFGGQTLTLGGTVTVGGAGTAGGSGGGAETTLVLTTNEAGQTVVVQTIGGSGSGSATRTTRAARSSGSTSGVGGFINSGLGGGRATAAASSTAGAVVGRGRGGVGAGVVGMVLGLFLGVVGV